MNPTAVPKNTLDKLFHKNFRALKMTLTKLVNRVFDQRLHFNEASTGFFFHTLLVMSMWYHFYFG